MLNHWYHHRGQLSVYLRLLDVLYESVLSETAPRTIPPPRTPTIPPR